MKLYGLFLHFISVTLLVLSTIGKIQVEFNTSTYGPKIYVFSTVEHALELVSFLAREANNSGLPTLTYKEKHVIKVNSLDNIELTLRIIKAIDNIEIAYFETTPEDQAIATIHDFINTFISYEYDGEDFFGGSTNPWAGQPQITGIEHTLERCFARSLVVREDNAKMPANNGPGPSATESMQRAVHAVTNMAQGEPLSEQASAALGAVTLIPSFCINTTLNVP